MRTDERIARQTDRKTDGQTERRTDMTKLTAAFHKFGQVPKRPNIWKFAVALGLMTVNKTSIRARRVTSGMEIGHPHRYVLYLKYNL